MRSLLSALALLLLFYLFLSGAMARFYASALFAFYWLTRHMWISVIMLGMFQTLILIPLRILRVRSSHHIKEFQETVESIGQTSEQQKKFKQDFRQGDQTFLFYLLDFMIQLLTFLSIGRLFLTDFYSKPLNPNLLYSFIPYPDYPILNVIFQIPYIVVTKIHQFGFKGVILGWAILLAVQLIFWLIKSYKNKTKEGKDYGLLSLPLSGKYGFAYILISLLLTWFVLTRFPVGFDLRIFKGDVGIPNQTLNTITAIATFSMLLWFGYKDIVRKTKLAYEGGVSATVVNRTRKKLFSQSVQSAFLVGVGAYFITNYIPSAFELSIFTFELIAVFAPLTLDKMIIKNMEQAQVSEKVSV